MQPSQKSSASASASSSSTWTSTITAIIKRTTTEGELCCRVQLIDQVSSAPPTTIRVTKDEAILQRTLHVIHVVIVSLLLFCLRRTLFELASASALATSGTSRAHIYAALRRVSQLFVSPVPRFVSSSAKSVSLPHCCTCLRVRHQICRWLWHARVTFHQLMSFMCANVRMFVCVSLSELVLYDFKSSHVTWQMSSLTILLL